MTTYTAKAKAKYAARMNQAYRLLKATAAQLGYKGTEGFDTFCDDAEQAGGVLELIAFGAKVNDER